jgi:WD40 repeat protein
MDRYLKVWETKSFKCIHTFLGHLNTIWSVDFCWNSNILGSSGSDKLIKLWSLSPFSYLCDLSEHSGIVLSLHFSENYLFSASGDKSVKVWDYTN